MNTSRLLILIAAAALTAGLYSLPRNVVSNENKQLGGRTTEAKKADTTVSDVAATHNAPMSAEQRRQLEPLRSAWAAAPAGERGKATERLAEFFRGANRFDSAAYYVGKLAEQQPTEVNLLRAGDQYYEAYTFAVDGPKAAALGEQTRRFYQKALAQNPNLLAAKANLAMTYVNTDTPMQGISMLREVLAQDPTNELALFNLGMLSMRSGQFEKAADRFRQILAVNPGSRRAKFYLGVSLNELGQKAEARKVLADVKATEKDPQILAAIRELEGQLK